MVADREAESTGSKRCIPCQVHWGTAGKTVGDL